MYKILVKNLGVLSFTVALEMLRSVSSPLPRQTNDGGTRFLFLGQQTENCGVK